MEVLDFFSGIGGLHVGLESAAERQNVNYKVAKAFEVNAVCNSVYRHRYPSTPICNKIVESLSFSDVFKKWRSLSDSDQVWMLSPPCQPYTSGGNRLDEKDGRSTAMLHLIELLKMVDEALYELPDAIFVENVPEFVTSNVGKALIEVLISRNYMTEKFVLSSLDIGIPNSRKRFYLVAIRSSKGFDLDLKMIFPLPINESKLEMKDFCFHYSDAQLEDDMTNSPQASDCSLQDLMVPQSQVAKLTGMKMDVIHPNSTNSITITKGYSTFLGKTGPVISIHPKGEVCKKTNDRFEYVDHYLIRRLSPREILNLHGFPKDFKFPDGISLKSQWSLIGNSVCVPIVSNLLEYIIIQLKSKKRII